MASMPDDMLFYFNTTDGQTRYFSVYYRATTNEIYIAEIDQDELWGLVNDAGLQLTEVSPDVFVYQRSLPPTVTGTVKVFIIK